MGQVSLGKLNLNNMIQNSLPIPRNRCGSSPLIPLQDSTQDIQLYLPFTHMETTRCCSTPYSTQNPYAWEKCNTDKWRNAPVQIDEKSLIIWTKHSCSFLWEESHLNRIQKVCNNVSSMKLSGYCLAKQCNIRLGHDCFTGVYLDVTSYLLNSVHVERKILFLAWEKKLSNGWMFIYFSLRPRDFCFWSFRMGKSLK